MELLKIPTRNHTRKAITTKKSAVTMAESPFPIVALMLPDCSPSSSTSASSSLIRRASAKSCSIESFLKRDDGGDADETDVGSVVDNSSVAEAFSLLLLLRTGAEEDEAETLPPMISRTS